MVRSLPFMLLLAAPLSAAEPGQDYLDFVRKQAAALRAGDKPPVTLDESAKRSEELRKNLLAAWGGFPEKPCPLDPQSHGELKRDGYRVEKITFQTRPGVRMTANLYLPDKKGKLPAILMVHGHWKGAKQDPVVQSRCIGAAKLGYVVLCVDAFGAGERAIGTALGEYHGDMTAATLVPVGLPLSGLQVYENMRAVDYLLTRPEVDGERLGITGASGGGNQSMYAGAFDTRFKSVVPVCSVGNYQAYLGAACCMCEVVPGALRFTEEGGILALTAPRGLMVVNATRDARQFSVDEAKKSLAYANSVFKLHSLSTSAKHAIFDSPHDYSRAMREEMYGWMAMNLKSEGDGTPIKEPEFKTENPEDLRCFPGNTRPKDWVTLPQFAAAEGKKLLVNHAMAANPDEARKALVKALGGFPTNKPEKTEPWDGDARGFRGTFEVEPGIKLEVSVRHDLAAPKLKNPPLAIILRTGEKSNLKLDAAALEAGWTVAIFDLRATGKYAIPNETIGRAPDHNSAEWGLWIGRPLLGQWVADLRQILTGMDMVAKDRDIFVIGEGHAGLVALCAAATDDRITKAAAVGSLASWVSDVPYEKQRLGLMLPGVLRDVGDVGHIAALAAPRKVLIVGGVCGDGKELTLEQLRAAYAPAKSALIEEKLDAVKVIEKLK
jgi:cephalosporin-C deacetylase-like acetyl esterase